MGTIIRDIIKMGRMLLALLLVGLVAVAMAKPLSPIQKSVDSEEEEDNVEISLPGIERFNIDGIKASYHDPNYLPLPFPIPENGTLPWGYLTTIDVTGIKINSPVKGEEGQEVEEVPQINGRHRLSRNLKVDNTIEDQYVIDASLGFQYVWA